MAKLKRSETFTVEREKEIQQVSKSCIDETNDLFCVLDGLRAFSLFSLVGCGICERACSDHEGFISTSHRPGQ